MNLRISLNAGNLLNSYLSVSYVPVSYVSVSYVSVSYVSVSFSGRTLLHGVGWLVGWFFLSLILPFFLSFLR